mmetsp:Transcript_35948/g.71531  ORF Transcript_35948/g.71531 Transcript_35948/m.71531 type:complete len:168 (-) Transcript_35948:177-680(-)
MPRGAGSSCKLTTVRVGERTTFLGEDGFGFDGGDAGGAAVAVGGTPEGKGRLAAPSKLQLHPLLSQKRLRHAFDGLPASYGMSELSRGPYCPSSQFWIAHRNDLPLVLASFDLWAEAYEAQRWPGNVLRWESTTCSLLAADEANQWLRFNWLDKAPPLWMQRCGKVS